MGGRKRGVRFVIYKAGWKRGLIVIQQSEAAEEGNLRREMPDADVNFLSGDIHNLPSQDPVGRVDGNFDVETVKE